jgi:hypothetical protein
MILPRLATASVFGRCAAGIFRKAELKYLPKGRFVTADTEVTGHASRQPSNTERYRQAERR